MNNLSNREKTLLKLLGVILFIAVFVLMIFKPQMEQLEANKLELQETEFKKQEFDAVLSRYGKQDSVIEEKTLELNTKDDYVLSFMDNEEIEKFIMDIGANGLDILYMDITDPVVTNFDPYLVEVSAEEGSYNLKDYYEYANGEKEVIASNVSDKAVSLLKNTVQLSLACSYDQYTTFISNINDSNLSIYVSGSERSLNDQTGEYSYFVTLDIYSVQGKE